MLLAYGNIISKNLPFPLGCMHILPQENWPRKTLGLTTPLDNMGSSGGQERRIQTKGRDLKQNFVWLVLTRV